MRWTAESVARSVLIYLFSAVGNVCCWRVSVRGKGKLASRMRNRILVALWPVLRRAKMFRSH